MRSITVTMWVTLDGVVQGLARPDEDTRGGFTQGGWGPRYGDEVLSREMANAMSKPGDMLLGRRTWQDFSTVWGRATDGNPFTTRMNATTKYVVSRSLEDADAWQNSILLRGDAVDTIADLKAQPGGDLGIIGSASLVRSLPAAAGQRHAAVRGPGPAGRVRAHRQRCDHQGRDHRPVRPPVRGIARAVARHGSRNVGLAKALWLAGCLKHGQPQVAVRVDLVPARRRQLDGDVHEAPVPAAHHHRGPAGHPGVDRRLGQAQAVH